MEYKNAHGVNLSAFSLGTVQLGMTYGLGEDKAKPTPQKAFAILDRAMELGVNNLDTANDYGDSEVLIGQWMQNRAKAGLQNPWVVTKIGPFDHSSPQKLRDDILCQVEGCRNNLRVDTLDCVMIHDFADYDCDRDTVRRVFEELKAQKVITKSGISAYSGHDYGVIADSGFDVTQIPLNVFDWRQIENGGLQKLKDAGMAVFVRSVFLQGLVFHTPADLGPEMQFCAPYLQKYLCLCREFDLSPAVLALSFVLSVPGVTSAVLGCDNPGQVEENARLFEKVVQLTSDQWAQLRQAFLDIDPRVVDPRIW